MILEVFSNLNDSVILYKMVTDLHRDYQEQTKNRPRQLKEFRLWRNTQRMMEATRGVQRDEEGRQQKRQRVCWRAGIGAGAPGSQAGCLSVGVTPRHGTRRAQLT